MYARMVYSILLYAAPAWFGGITAGKYEPDSQEGVCWFPQYLHTGGRSTGRLSTRMIVGRGVACQKPWRGPRVNQWRN